MKLKGCTDKMTIPERVKTWGTTLLLGVCANAIWDWIKSLRGISFRLTLYDVFQLAYFIAVAGVGVFFGKKLSCAALERLAADDTKNMFARVFAVKWEPHRACFDPSNPNDPHIDFKVTFVNASIFQLESPRLQGSTFFNNQPLASQPNLDQAFTLSRGKTWMVIRQFVTREIAREMQDRINADKGVVNLDFSRLRITFDTKFSDRPTGSFTWEGHSGVSVKEITTFD